MCYLVTCDHIDIQPTQYQTLPEARKYAESLAFQGYKEVRVWLLTHSVAVQPQAVWTDHAKGITGNHKE